MPFSYLVSEPLDLVVITAKGELTPQGLYDCTESYQSNPAFHPGIDMLIAIKPSLRVEMAGRDSTDEKIIDEVVGRVRDVRGKRTYQVACAGGTVEEHTFFLASLEMMNRHMDTKAFDTTREALHWLGREGATWQDIEHQLVPS